MSETCPKCGEPLRWTGMIYLCDKCGETFDTGAEIRLSHLLAAATARAEKAEAQLAITENGGRHLAAYILQDAEETDENYETLSLARAMVNLRGGTTPWLEEALRDKTILPAVAAYCDELRTEVLHLRGLVEVTYREGWLRGHLVAKEEAMNTPSDDWGASTARRNLNAPATGEEQNNG